MIGLMITLIMGGSFMPQLAGPLPIFHGPDLSQPNVTYNFWCNGNRCDDHDIKGYIKSMDAEGNITWYTTEEQINLDIDSLEDWQIIRYTQTELNNLDIVPEDCTSDEEIDGTCGFGLSQP